MKACSLQACEASSSKLCYVTSARARTASWVPRAPHHAVRSDAKRCTVPKECALQGDATGSDVEVFSFSGQQHAVMTNCLGVDSPPNIISNKIPLEADPPSKETPL